VPWQVSAVSQMSWYVCYPIPTPVVAIQGNLYAIIQMIGWVQVFSVMATNLHHDKHFVDQWPGQLHNVDLWCKRCVSYSEFNFSST
jgi:hypothetical protein